MSGIKYDNEKPKYELLGHAFKFLLESRDSPRRISSLVDSFFFDGASSHAVEEAIDLLFYVYGIEVDEVVQVLEFGAEKYGKWNYMGGFKYSRMLGAFRRHLYAIDTTVHDEETGLRHAAHALCCLLFLLEFEDNKSKYKDFDDRPKGESNCDVK